MVPQMCLVNQDYLYLPDTGGGGLFSHVQSTLYPFSLPLDLDWAMLNTLIDYGHWFKWTIHWMSNDVGQ